MLNKNKPQIGIRTAAKIATTETSINNTKTGAKITVKKAMKFKVNNRSYLALKYNIATIGTNTNLSTKQGLLLAIKGNNANANIVSMNGYSVKRLDKYNKSLIKRYNRKVASVLKSNTSFKVSTESENLLTKKENKLKLISKHQKDLTTINADLFKSIYTDFKEAKLAKINAQLTNKQVLQHVRGYYSKDDANIDLAFYIISNKLDLDYKLPLTTLKRAVKLHQNNRISKSTFKKIKDENELSELLANLIKKYNAIDRAHKNAIIVANANKVTYSDLPK